MLNRTGEDFTMGWTRKNTPPKGLIMIVFAFDVDHTLWISAGPVQSLQLIHLKAQGHILGLCGNWGLVTKCLAGWQNIFSFIGPIESTKAAFLRQIKTHVPAGRYIMVGNDGDGQLLSADRAAAQAAGWEFVLEKDFAGMPRDLPALS
jgi:hypothetical protein